jgi:DNA-binding response OmpR family regulator
MAKILIIDDDGIVRDALAVFLTRAGHDVAAAADGANGLLLFRNDRPDLVVLDRDLPALSGSEVLAGIRALDRKAAVIVLTGYDSAEDAGRYLSSGAASFLSKGDGLSNVLVEIERLLGSPAKKAERPAAEPVPVGEVSPGGKARILVADDDVHIVMVLSRFLVAEGYTVFSAVNGAAALVVAEREKPDMVLLDINMPGMSGVDVLRSLSEKMPDTGVLMITGNSDEEVARTCLKNGAFDYLSKPVNLASLGTIVKARLLVQKKKND